MNKITPEHHPAFLSDRELPLSRRSMMKWMGAGLALMGVSLPACRRVEKYLVPYNEGPEWVISGLGTSYATTMPWVKGCFPLLATCYDGRVTKLEPSFQYPDHQGLLPCVQASVLDVYDPNRSQQVLYHEKPVSQHEWQSAFAVWAKRIASGESVAIVLNESVSPLQYQMCQDLQKKNPNVHLYSWEVFSHRAQYDAWNTLMGHPGSFTVDFKKIKNLVSLDCDFLGWDTIGNVLDFAQAKEAKDGLCLYMAESRVSLSGLQADRRLPVRPSRIPHLLCALAYRLDVLLDSSLVPGFEVKPGDYSELEQNWLDDACGQLISEEGKSAVVLGQGYDAIWHQLTLKINEVLQALNTCLVVGKREEPMPDPIEGMISRLAEEKLDMVIFLSGSNPVAEIPKTWQLHRLLDNHRVTSIHLGLYVDETARACQWHFPASHYLESWGMDRDLSGRLCLRQPTMLPWFESFSAEELLLALNSSKGELASSWNSPSHVSPVYFRLQKCFKKLCPQLSADLDWTLALQRGYVDGSQYEIWNHRPNPIHTQSWKDAVSALSKSSDSGWNVQMVPDYRFYDGRFARNAWLRECPDPITGISWDTCAQTYVAADCLETGKPIPCYLWSVGQAENAQLLLVKGYPAMPPRTLVIPLGGEIQEDALSCSSYQSWLRAFNTQELRTNWYLEEPAWFAKVQDMVLTLADTKPVWADRQMPNSFGVSLGKMQWLERPEEPCAWGMYIDLSRCTGCNACMVACRAENNIPIVGKDQMSKGRSMDWIRIDKYFMRDEAQSLSLWSMPVACQQCGAAPCESVCPVNATVHTSEGLNAMVYGRCWGTRYCATNCPYKARRFNFFDYSKQSAPSRSLQSNPNVTVRSRGVMEKCTYCVQRLEEAKIRHKAQVMKAWELGDKLTPLGEKDFLLPDGAVMTACQASCPMGAIHFGNRKDPDAHIKACDALSGSGQLLGHLGTKPSTVYRVKNWKNL